ncbi:LAMI_0H12178g1_1 [Lachancea mirantina]|uniref:LAMI_0H12178g1_1 n=1 Tax=Lachancea mirantina TaxID=1230905 RepID=A0A1G4KHJ6_9SACH|nr:LAMI_0H12178g1_1 [Lachancea mirantina]
MKFFTLATVLSSAVTLARADFANVTSSASLLPTSVLPPTTVTDYEVVTEFTTYCPEPTTFITNGQTYTVHNATTLTITNCPCTIPVTSIVEAPKTVTEVEVVTELTTYCPEPTTIVTNGATYTVTSATTLTITECPCTVTRTSTISSSAPASSVHASSAPASSVHASSAPASSVHASSVPASSVLASSIPAPGTSTHTTLSTLAPTSRPGAVSTQSMSTPNIPTASTYTGDANMLQPGNLVAILAAAGALVM